MHSALYWIARQQGTEGKMFLGEVQSNAFWKWKVRIKRQKATCQHVNRDRERNSSALILRIEQPAANVGGYAIHKYIVQYITKDCRAERQRLGDGNIALTEVTLQEIRQEFSSLQWTTPLCTLCTLFCTALSLHYNALCKIALNCIFIELYYYALVGSTNF